MDGLLIDSETWTLRAWKDACLELGFELTDEICHQGIGKGRKEFKLRLTDHFGDDFDADKAERLREEIGRVKVEKDGLPLKPGALELLAFIAEQKLPLALATSTGRSEALFRLNAAGLDLSLFNASVCGEEAGRKKPYPDPYLAAAKLLRVAPESIFAFEDSPTGVSSALEAGMTVFCVPDILTVQPLPGRKLLLHKSLLECLDTLRSLFRNE